MIDLERTEVEIANHVDMLSLHLKKLEAFYKTATREQKKRGAVTAHKMVSRVVMIATRARRVSSLYPRLIPGE